MTAPNGWPARYPIAQPPNPPLILAAAGWLLAALTHGSIDHGARATFYVGLSAWAWLELTEGVNLFRRALGAAGLVFVVVKVAEALGG
ncbi:MAG: hypothetical protein JWM73_2470 [Solirubrobacterales bacterium]|nr:hypothetical protein [Solirubrobacterales bacterium]